MDFSDLTILPETGATTIPLLMAGTATINKFLEKNQNEKIGACQKKIQKNGTPKKQRTR